MSKLKERLAWKPGDLILIRRAEDKTPTAPPADKKPRSSRKSRARKPKD